MGFLIHIPSSPRLGNGYAKGHTRYLKIRTTLNAERGDARPRYAPGGRKRVMSSERGSFAAVRGNTVGTVSSWTFKVSERELHRDMGNAELTIPLVHRVPDQSIRRPRVVRQISRQRRPSVL